MTFTCRICGGYMISATDGIRCGACGRKPELFPLDATTEPKPKWVGILDRIIDPAAEINRRRQETTALAEKATDTIDPLERISVRDGKSAKYLLNLGEDKGKNG